MWRHINGAEGEEKETVKWRLHQSQPRLVALAPLSPTTSFWLAFFFLLAHLTKNIHFFSLCLIFVLCVKHIFIRICAKHKFLLFNFWTCSTIFAFLLRLLFLHSFLQNRRKKCTNLLWRSNLNLKTTYQVTFWMTIFVSCSFFVEIFEYFSSPSFLCKYSLFSLHSRYPRC